MLNLFIYRSFHVHLSFISSNFAFQHYISLVFHKLLQSQSSPINRNTKQIFQSVSYEFHLAERRGFEPPDAVIHRTLSKRVPSTTRPPLQTYFNISLYNNIKDVKGVRLLMAFDIFYNFLMVFVQFIANYKSIIPKR